MQEIVPKKGLGLFTLEDSINKTLSIIKQNGNIFKQCDIILNNTPFDPLYLVIPKENIKLRFNPYTQRLELIEKTFPSTTDNKSPSQFEYSFNSKMIFSSTNTDRPYYSEPDYQYINTIFGISQMPILLNNGANAFLPYHGIGFIFQLTQKVKNPKDFTIDSSERLNKLIIFSDKTISESIGKENSLLECPSPLIKVNAYYLEEGINFIFYNLHSIGGMETNFNIYIGDAYEEVLHKMKNPNYVYYPQSGPNEEGGFDIIGSNSKHNVLNEDCLLNYFSYGVDIYICGKRNVVKKIILHCNNPQESKFGIYERANFIIEINKMFISGKTKKSKENCNVNSNNNNTFNNVRLSSIVNASQTNSSRKFSDDYLTQEEAKSTKGDEIENEICKNSFTLKGNANSEQEIGGSKSENDSENENDGIILVFPWTNFNNILKQIPDNVYTIFQKHDNKIKRVNKYYVFNGIAFETLDDGTINAITIFEN